MTLIRILGTTEGDKSNVIINNASVKTLHCTKVYKSKERLLNSMPKNCQEMNIESWPELKLSP